MIKITTPLPEKISANEVYAGQHWSKRKKQADLFHQSLLEFRNKYEIDDFPVTIQFIFYFKGSLLDVDNCFYMAKLFIDSLRGIKLLPDDTPKYINEVSITVVKDKKDEVEIIII